MTDGRLWKVAGHPISLQLGYRYYADAREGGPDRGLRFTFTPLFLKRRQESIAGLRA